MPDFVSPKITFNQLVCFSQSAALQILSNLSSVICLSVIYLFGCVYVWSNF